MLGMFSGEIYQKPPLRASVKHEPRKRTIYELEPLEIDSRRVLFRVACQSGTYIRKLCFDMGELLGFGAHMQELRRSRAGAFTENDGLTNLHEIVDAKAMMDAGEISKIRDIIKPMESAFEYIPKIVIRDSAVDAICHGAELAVPGILRLDSDIQNATPVAIFSLKAEIVALAKAKMSTQQILDNEKGIAAKTVRVIMPRGTYPRKWKRPIDVASKTARN